MGSIRILDDHIANQIAAGEVVERPSSVVKELVENAIDAGSTRIDIAIEEGGLHLIRVVDNGSGMSIEDCELAFERHATSKLRTGNDLFKIRSLGFRGEALPSIAAVARVECVTAHNDSGLGHKIVLEGGERRLSESCSASRGTQIVVKDLFFNTPARLKYMKTIQTELGHVSDYVYRLALARPDIAFSLKHHDHTLLRTQGNGDLLQVVAAIYGTSAAKLMLPVEGENLDYRIHGLVSKPELTRANRYGISMIVNGRYIRNNALSGALIKAYHTLLPLHRFPLAVLHIHMEPELIDVNVHPSKLEVRFSKEIELAKLLSNTVRSALDQLTLIPQGTRPSAQRQKPEHIQEQLPLYEMERQADPMPSMESPDRRLESDTRRKTGGITQDEKVDPEAVRHFMNGLKHPPNLENPSELPSDHLSKAPVVRKDHEESQLAQNLANSRMPKLHAIGQMRSTYIVAQNEDGLFLIDQHAAHERLNYEYYYEKFGQPQRASQELLLPITLELTSVEAEIIKDRLHCFEQVGVYMEPFGGNTFKITAYPHWFPKGEEKAIIEEMVGWVLQEKKAPDIAKMREKSSILCSCKASIKANQPLSNAEIEELLSRLQRARNPFTCPHGRPIMVSFSNYELEKMFKRVM